MTDHFRALAEACWQPIETAPKNRKIDLGSLHEKGFKRAPDCYWSRKRQVWNCDHHDADGYSLIRLPFTPTHWMERPASPGVTPVESRRPGELESPRPKPLAEAATQGECR